MWNIDISYKFTYREFIYSKIPTVLVLYVDIIPTLVQISFFFSKLLDWLKSEGLLTTLHI